MSIIPYGRQCIDDDDIQAVVETLRSDYLTTGPCIDRFESSVKDFCGSPYAVAVSNGTAALHATMFALGIGPGDEVIVPPMTFAASANCVLYQGGTPVFCDVDAETLLIDPAAAEAKITDRTRAIIGVDYAGQPCDWPRLREIADRHGLALVADGCHALGATLNGKFVGTLADMTVFSFHPVKHVTTGEGGMILTGNEELATRLRNFRNHGITTDARTRDTSGAWFYEMQALGYNYRMTDIQAALGASQMTKLPDFLRRRREIAAIYDERFAGTAVRPLALRPEAQHAYHLYVVRLQNRNKVYEQLRDANIRPQVHYIPVHLHPYYQENLGTREGDCPAAEAAYREILSLPMYPALNDEEQEYVIRTLLEVA
ncbi:UDP-4-amino-4,6-dideoxy-N-acetyl-beta-L-altrosamine transaminase [Pseudodesulfovibrio sp.]|uniref:UDP-4-amino-4, 6-dideoxy-N-acetyl-beta-L-altrosamine transaminase n=1 Tax=unclassified Pseudodesulfovibrio TaxID=2661612 RepID=UPI003B000889